jgi:hypothetical protein
VHVRIHVAVHVHIRVAVHVCIHVQHVYALTLHQNILLRRQVDYSGRKGSSIMCLKRHVHIVLTLASRTDVATNRLVRYLCVFVCCVPFQSAGN